MDEPVETDRCPNCGKPSVIPGHINSGFVPLGCRMFVPYGGVPYSVDNAPRACVSCGHVWAALDPDKLRDFIEANGEEIARQGLDEIDRGPYRDLPDTALAREIAEHIAEIDRLVREGRSGLIGRYRETKGVTWDQAIKETKNWSRLTREEKLALFGWVPKKKPPVDDLDDPLL